MQTWSELDVAALSLLGAASHQSGKEAQSHLPQLNRVAIPRSVSLAVFKRSLNEQYYPMTIQLFPGVQALVAEAQVALISVVFNRGNALGHDPDWRTATELDSRWEIRRLQDDVRRADLFAIYIHLGTMKRVWEESGPRGLLYRRRDEQHLIRPYVDKVLHWEENRDRLKEAGAPPCQE